MFTVNKRYLIAKLVANTIMDKLAMLNPTITVREPESGLSNVEGILAEVLDVLYKYDGDLDSLGYFVQNAFRDTEPFANDMDIFSALGFLAEARELEGIVKSCVEIALGSKAFSEGHVMG